MSNAGRGRRRAHSPEEVERIKANLFRPEVLEYLTNRQHGELLHAPVLGPLATGALLVGLFGAGLLVAGLLGYSRNVVVDATVESASTQVMVVSISDRTLLPMPAEQSLHVWSGSTTNCIPDSVEFSGVHGESPRMLLTLRVRTLDDRRCHSRAKMIARGERISLLVAKPRQSLLSFLLGPERFMETQ